MTVVAAAEAVRIPKHSKRRKMSKKLISRLIIIFADLHSC